MALDKVLAAYVSIMRGTPLAIQLTIMAFIIMAGFPNKIVVLLGVRRQLRRIRQRGHPRRHQLRGRGADEAGRSLGLSQLASMRLIILPQAVKNILPALCNEGIAVLKETLHRRPDLGGRPHARQRPGAQPHALALLPADLGRRRVLPARGGLSAAVSRLERRLRQSDRHKNLHKRFGRLEVLRGINETIDEGERVVLIGASGSARARCCAA